MVGVRCSILRSAPRCRLRPFALLRTRSALPICSAWSTLEVSFRPPAALWWRNRGSLVGACNFRPPPVGASLARWGVGWRKPAVESAQVPLPHMVSFDPSPASLAQSRPLLPILMKRQQSARPVFRLIGHDQIDVASSPDTVRGARRRDDRCAHRHGLEDLVLHAAGDPQRRYRRKGMGEVGAHVGNPSGYFHVRQVRQSAHGTRRPRADDIKPYRHAGGAQLWHDPAGEPPHRIDIRPVIHGAREDDGYYTWHVRTLVASGSEIFE